MRSLEDLLVSEEVAEEKDEGIVIKNIGLLTFGKRPDKLIFNYLQIFDYAYRDRICRSKW